MVICRCAASYWTLAPRLSAITLLDIHLSALCAASAAAWDKVHPSEPVATTIDSRRVHRESTRPNLRLDPQALRQTAHGTVFPQKLGDIIGPQHLNVW
jgi:hypothetical protein